jgi:hypothetical protein
MSLVFRKPLQIGLAAMMGIGALFASEQLAQIGAFSLVSKAEARIGRPLTPFSYAGVARRTTRRAYGYGAGVYGAGIYGAPVYGAPLVYGAPFYAPACYQAANAYGELYARCP